MKQNRASTLVYMALILVILLSLWATRTPAPEADRETRLFYEQVNQLSQSEQPVLLDAEFGPAMMAEMEPILRAVMHHLLASGQKVVLVTFLSEQVAILKRMVTELKGEYDLVYGRDILFLGYASAYAYTMAGMGHDLSLFYHQDAYGTPVDELPLFGQVSRLQDFAGVISVAANVIPAVWIQYAVTPYQLRFVAAVTAAQAAEYQPFLQTGQLDGLLKGGLWGAAYSRLVRQRVTSRLPDNARTVGAVVNGLWLVVLLLVLGLVRGGIRWWRRRGAAS